MIKTNKPKKLLRKNKLLRKYNKKFKSRQMRYIISLIAHQINPEITKKELFELETKTLIVNGEKMYDYSCENIFKGNKDKKYENSDWKSLSMFLFYTFETSNYYRDKASNKDNIYISSDPFNLNMQKKVYWNNFVLTTLDNELIKKILRKIK
ncbi:MAG: hypothetical protein GY679_05135 [Mycoplasma sp.]|nr:hypothetical protein [Mycoplasma sp.]